MFDIKKNETEFKDISEVGVTRGLIAYYPLTKDTKEYSNGNDAINNGAILTTEGYSFDGVDDTLTTENYPEGLGSKNQITLSVVCYSRSEGWARLLMVGDHNHAQLDISTSGTLRLYSSHTEIYDNHNSIYDSQARLNQWVHVCGVVTGTEMILYVNGIEVNRTTSSGLSNLTNPTISIGHDHRNSTNSYDGILREVRVHDVALTPQEVALQAKLDLNQTNLEITKDCVYTKNQFKEVIA